MYERYGKRLLDIVLSLAATIILAIPMGLVALWIKLDSPGPVFFKQRRGVVEGGTGAMNQTKEEKSSK